MKWQGKTGKIWLSWLCCLLMFTTTSVAQSIPRDTSFTLHSAYSRAVKEFPFIQLAGLQQPAGIVVKRNVVYATIGHRKLHADVCLPSPANKGKHPVVVLLHGGGWKSGSKEMALPMAMELAARGFVTVAVEYRLSPEAKYPAGMVDVRRAIQWLRHHQKAFGADGRQVAVLGTSSGGQMAALLGTTNGNRFFYPNTDTANGSVQAVINIDGVLAFHHPESAEGAVAAEWLGGSYTEKPAVWAQASALYNTSAQTVPVLFVNSSLPRFHAGRDDMITKLNRHGIYSEVHTFNNTPHTFWLFEPWFAPVVDKVTAFLQKVFKQL